MSEDKAAMDVTHAIMADPECHRDCRRQEHERFIGFVEESRFRCVWCKRPYRTVNMMPLPDWVMEKERRCERT